MASVQGQRVLHTAYIVRLRVKGGSGDRDQISVTHVTPCTGCSRDSWRTSCSHDVDMSGVAGTTVHTVPLVRLCHVLANTNCDWGSACLTVEACSLPVTAARNICGGLACMNICPPHMRLSAVCCSDWQCVLFCHCLA